MSVTLKRQAGASMIEVLVALLILSIGLLGLAMLQGKTLRVNSDAMFRSQATLLANEIIESMRANTTGANTGLYKNMSGTKPSACGSCSGYTKAANDDLRAWYDAQADTLPAPSSTIDYDPISGKYTITMIWNERGISTQQVWEVTI
ncbi:MAG: type IV pilus modification protein PilV [Acidiferrobacterales bacterium]